MNIKVLVLLQGNMLFNDGTTIYFFLTTVSKIKKNNSSRFSFAPNLEIVKEIMDGVKEEFPSHMKCKVLLET